MNPAKKELNQSQKYINQSNNPINAINPKSKKKETFDSETCENSNSNSENIQIKKPYKRSVDFFPKQMDLEQIQEEDITKRRNTISKFGKIKNFVPQLKPIKIDLVPSKLRLNRIGFKDLKCNKNNKILLYANKYFISCPNIQDEEDNEEIENLYLSNEINTENKKEDMHQTRKNLLKVKNKNNIPKVCSVNNSHHLKNKFNNDLNIGCSSDSDLYDIYDIDEEINNNSINDNTEDNFKINFVSNNINNKLDDCNKKRDRYYSWSILDVLQNKNKLDENMK